MNVINSLMNTLKVDVSKNNEKTVKSKDDSFESYLNKASNKYDDKKHSKDEVEVAEKDFDVEEEKAIDNSQEISKLEDEIKELEEKDRQDVTRKIIDLIAILLNGNLKDSNVDLEEMNQKLSSNSLSANDLLSIDLIKALQLLEKQSDLSSLINQSSDFKDLLGNNSQLLSLLKELQGSSKEDVKSIVLNYLKANKSSELNNINAKGTEKSQETTDSIRNLFDPSKINSIASSSNSEVENSELLKEVSVKPVDIKLSSETTKEENILQNIIQGNNGSKGLNFRDSITNQLFRTTDSTMVNKNNFGEDILKSIKFMDFNNLKELTVKVVPRELGEIAIKLTLDSGVMKANLSVTNKETYEMLNANYSDISEKLQANNVKVGSVNINLYEEDTTYFSGESKEQQSNQQQGNGKSKQNFINEDEEIKKEFIDNRYFSYFV